MALTKDAASTVATVYACALFSSCMAALISGTQIRPAAPPSRPLTNPVTSPIKVSFFFMVIAFAKRHKI